jgi:hypothetical protein
MNSAWMHNKKILGGPCRADAFLVFSIEVPEIWNQRRKINMEKSKTKSIPKFSSLDELVAFFETHGMGEYWDQMPEAHFDIEIKKRTHIFSLDEDMAETLTKIAKAKRIPS